MAERYMSSIMEAGVSGYRMAECSKCGVATRGYQKKGKPVICWNHRDKSGEKGLIDFEEEISYKRYSCV